MHRTALMLAYGALMVVTIVTVDLLFFRHRFQARLVANVVIVLAFLAFYLLLLRKA